MNTMTIDGYPAVIAFDPDIQMFRGEFVGLNGGADFYAADVEGLKREGEISLRIHLEFCKERGIKPHRSFSEELSLRLDPSIHKAAAIAAATQGKSLNQWVTETIKQAVLEE